ncbi:hypothetical protein SteCoe_21080 [Stentor coeruleus]|uniref:SEC7 domain-containing protein n=1 Tax=Stentor coeruleus TaxID=5963 RepID=A0A1R2BQE5_9CILI|nr:hypothetical protein SteCoe_21080 [Stentor coeruleus]
MGNSPVVALSYNETGKCSSIFQSCSSLTELDVDELAIHREVGMPRGRLCPEAMKYLDRTSKGLMFACTGTSALHVRKYINYGASPDTYDQNRTSPLHISCRSGNLEVVKELVSHRCNMDITDCAGWSSLHIASHCGHSEIVEFLLGCGADASIVNSRGETPFDLAHDSVTQKKFFKYWGTFEDSIKSDLRLSRVTRPLTPYSEEYSVLTENWMRIGAIHTTYNLIKLEEIIKNVFNNNHLKGLSMLITGEIVSQRPLEIAMYFFSTPGLSPVKIGMILGDTHEICKDIAKEFISFLQIEPHNLLVSLSKMLKLIKLPKGMMADQVLDLFSERFFSFNGPFLSKDSVHHLVFSIINLNNCLHVENESISKEEFIQSNKGMHDGGDFPEKYLSWIYDSVKNESIQGVFHEQIAPVFEEVTISGYLRYKLDTDWKEKYFILNSNALWSFKSTTQATPYGCIPLSNTVVSVNTNYFMLTGNITFIRFSEDGSSSVQHFANGIFRMDNPDLWIAGLQLVK